MRTAIDISDEDVFEVSCEAAPVPGVIDGRVVPRHAILNVGTRVNRVTVRMRERELFQITAALFRYFERHEPKILNTFGGKPDEESK